MQPEMYALVGMGAVLGAVVQAPLAGILILFDVTRDDKVMLPAMLATIVAAGFARVLLRDSIDTLALRRRGVYVGGGAMSLLHRTTIEQVDLDPAAVVGLNEPLAKVIDAVAERRRQPRPRRRAVPARESVPPRPKSATPSQRGARPGKSVLVQ